MIQQSAISTVGALLIANSRLLLGLRAPHRSWPNCWDVIGGHVETGETHLEAIIREVWEEIGVHAIEPRLIRSIPLTDINGRLVIIDMFVIDRWRGVPRLANDEHTALRWFTHGELEQLSSLADESYREIIAVVLKSSAAKPPS